MAALPVSIMATGVCLVEDRSGLTSGNDKAPILAIIDGATGAIIKEAFVIRQDVEIHADGWDGLTSFAGGFALKVNGNADGSEPFIQFYDNDGNQTALWTQLTNLDDVDQPIPFDPRQQSWRIHDDDRRNGPWRRKPYLRKSPQQIRLLCQQRLQHSRR